MVSVPTSEQIVRQSAGVRDTETTLGALFWQVATRRASDVAMRWKNLGIWNDIRWSEYADAARAVGCALLAAGCRRTDRVAVVSDTRPEWCFVEFGAMGIGAGTAGVHATCSAEQLACVVNDSGARVLFVQDQEQLDKALSVLGQMPGIERIIYFDGAGLHAFSHSRVWAFDRFCEDGRLFHTRNPARWETEVNAARPDDIATVAYTSGGMGAPKGVLLSNRNLLFQLQAMERLCPGKEGDEQLGFLSMSHIGERYFSVYRPLVHGVVVHMGKGLGTLLENLREVAPHVLMAVPRVWEKLHATVNVAIPQGTPLERWAYREALALGYRVVANRLAGQPVPTGLRVAYFMARLLVLNRVLSMMGLQRARLLASGAAPISPDIVRWFLALNLNMVEAYGLTESTGQAASHEAGAQRTGTVGKAIAGTQIKLTAEGEILIWGPNVFAGYLNQPDDTARALVDGWLRTGDMGSLDTDGHLRVTGRRDDIMLTANGTRVMPSGIEAQLKTSPFIADAILVGQGRPFLSCLILVDHDSVARHARAMNLVFTSYASLTRLAEVHSLVQREIDRVSRDFAGTETIRRFALIDAEISVLDPVMTPTLQLRRHVVTEKYRDAIDALYTNP